MGTNDGTASVTEMEDIEEREERKEKRERRDTQWPHNTIFIEWVYNLSEISRQFIISIPIRSTKEEEEEGEAMDESVTRSIEGEGAVSDVEEEKTG